MKNLLKALAGFQSENLVIHEDTKGYNYTYSNINTIFKVIKPLLKKHGLAFYQTLDMRSLSTTVFHIESGEKITSIADIPLVSLKGMNDYQTLGSGITYLRRYSLSVMLGLITDKDIDACGEQEPKNAKKVKGKLTQEIVAKLVEKDMGIELIKELYIVDLDQEKKLIKMLKDGSK